MTRLQTSRPAQAYESYFVPAIFARWAPVLIGHARPFPGERVLDVACGTGIVARTIAPQVGSHGRVVGADLNKAMLEVARELAAPAGTPIEWVECDACDLPYESEFDLVLCQQGLQFFDDAGAAARSMWRVLKPAGRAVASVWDSLEHHPVYHAIYESQARHLGLPIAGVARPFGFDGPTRLRHLFTEAGFQRVEVTTESRDVSFPSIDQFVALTLGSAPTVMPELVNMREEDRADLIRAIRADSSAVLERHEHDGRLVFAMHSSIVIAQMSA